MRLAKKILRLTPIFIGLFCIVNRSKAQINSPFSKYGIGNELLHSQNVNSQGMGGFSAAVTAGMNSAYGQSINFNNPASYGNLYMTTFDIGMNFTSTTLRRISPAGKEKSNYLIPNYLAFGAPINKAKKMGFAFGLRPITQINYSVTEFQVLSSTGDSVFNKYTGDGGMNQVFLGMGKSWKNISLGFNTGYNLGRKKVDVVKALKYNIDSSYFYESISSTNTTFGGFFLNVGLLGESSLKKITKPVTNDKTEYSISYGINYTLDQQLSGKQDLLRSTGSYLGNNEVPTDTVQFEQNRKGTISMPSFFTAGIAFHKKESIARGSYDQFVLGLEINHSNWNNKYSFYGKTDQVMNATMLRIGAQFSPNPYAYENYWSTVTYRLGYYLGKDYIDYDSKGLNIRALTLGIGLPVRKYRSYDYQFTLLNVALQIGTRGSNVNNFKEQFVQVSMGYSLSDIWFNKRKYE